MMESKNHSENLSSAMGRVNRVVAAVLAVIWIAGGIAGLFLSIKSNHIKFIVISLLALAYGGLWVRVAQTGRRLEWRRKDKR